MTLIQDLNLIISELPDKYLKDRSLWQSKLIDYEPPTVERIWTDTPDYRISLHLIYPCKGNPLKHVHPWPSAIKILEGSYITETGPVLTKRVKNSMSGSIDWVYKTSSVLHLTKGSIYTMEDSDIWHSVSPNEPTLTVMINGKPWKHHPSMNSQPKPGHLNPLTDERKEALLCKFAELLKGK